VALVRHESEAKPKTPLTSCRGRHMLAASPPTGRLSDACCCSPKRSENTSSSPAVTCGYGHLGRRRNVRLGGHAAAGDFLRNGGDAFALLKLLGHTTLAVTRMYVDLVAKDLAEAHKRASPGDNLRLRVR
jgi:hypothetical protein